MTARGNTIASSRIAPGPNAPRRHVMVAAATLPLLVSVAMWGMPRRAQAGAAAIPSALGELDRAAMALFDAAEIGGWSAARQALQRAQRAAGAVAPLESAFVDAGGELRHFFQARNDLVGDLIEAKTALSVRDRRWLVSAADRIAARAGELSQPFEMRANALLPRVESLLYLVRRMRRALVWQDHIGLQIAHDDFRRLWSGLKVELTAAPADRVRALDDALVSLSLSKSSADVQRLYVAVQQLRDTMTGR